MIVLNTHLFLCSPVIPPAIPLKKNNYFLSTSHLVYPFQKSVVLLTTASAYYVDNTMQCQKKEKKVRRQWYGLTCTSDNKTDERCHHRRNRRKKNC